MSLNERQCTVLLAYESSFMKESEYAERLESKDEAVKAEALKALISAIVSGEQYPKLLMSVIKFCLHSEHHLIKKLLLLYWEVVEKRGRDGHLLHEMILVCNALKNNITHPNEYIRGSTLRFLCKIKEAEILESLIPSITDNLQHRHSYVRKNAVLTVFNVFSAHPDLIPDAPELIEQFLYAETNPAAKRNAFLMLFHCSQEKAVSYLESVLSAVSGTGEAFQLIALELIRKVCRTNPTLKAAYIRAIFTLVNSPVHAVAYEGASTLTALSSAPTAVRAAVTAYTTLLASESENNIKLVILQRLAALRLRNEKVLQEMVMDILRTLSSPNTEIRRQTLTLALQLLNARNVEDVVQLLKKELIKADSPEQQMQTQQGGRQQGDGYRKMLVDAMHECAVRFPHVVSTVVHLLMNYVGDEQAAAALDVVYFVREIVEEYPQLRDDILLKVADGLQEVKVADVYRVCLWIIGEYAVQPPVLQRGIDAIKAAVGPLPLLHAASGVAAVSTATAAAAVTGGSEEEKRKEEEDHKSKVGVRKGPQVLADGTYASQSAASTFVPAAAPVNASSDASSSSSPLRSLLLHGDFFLGATLAATMTKLVLRYSQQVGFGSKDSNREIAQALLLFTSILRVGTVASAAKPIDPDSQQRITICMRVLLEAGSGSEGGLTSAFAISSRQVFADLLKDLRKKSELAAGKQRLVVKSQADDLISIRQLMAKGEEEDDGGDNEDTDLTRAVGSASSIASDISSTLHRVHQLTGFSDPVYAEAHLTVQSYDIVLDLLIVNQTAGILQNVSVELNTSGDLKVVERPAVHTLAAFASVRVQSTIKLSSTESGVIFGNIVYDNSSGTVKSIVVLNNIHLDIEDYIAPAYVTDAAFRVMWAEFEWSAAARTDRQGTA